MKEEKRWELSEYNRNKPEQRPRASWHPDPILQISYSILTNDPLVQILKNNKGKYYKDKKNENYLGVAAKTSYPLSQHNRVP